MIQGWCTWLTGRPGSGKSSIAKIIKEKSLEKGVTLQILSSDELRKIITPDPKYTEGERDLVYSSIVYIAKLLTMNGVNVLVDATGNRRKYRDNCRATIVKFKEIYLRCTVNVCIERESKRTASILAPNQIYKKTSIVTNTVPGFGSPYEEPLNPDLIIDTDKLDPEKSSELIVNQILTEYR